MDKFSNLKSKKKKGRKKERQEEKEKETKRETKRIRKRKSGVSDWLLGNEQGHSGHRDIIGHDT